MLTVWRVGDPDMLSDILTMRSIPSASNAGNGNGNGTADKMYHAKR